MRQELAQKTIVWRPVAGGRAGGAADQDPELRKWTTCWPNSLTAACRTTITNPSLQGTN